jgi:hypothetical protein
MCFVPLDLIMTCFLFPQSMLGLCECGSKAARTNLLPGVGKIQKGGSINCSINRSLLHKHFPKEHVTGNGTSFLIESHRWNGMRLRTEDLPSTTVIL